jgi:hypothetical protein
MPLPRGIDLDQYKTQAKELLKKAKLADPEALNRLRQHHPDHTTLLASGRIQLADAQLVIARELGYGSWAKLKEDLIFLNAVAALDAGDIPRLTSLINDHPSVLKYHCRTGMWYKEGHYKGSTLLHHVAGNQSYGHVRIPLPPNVVEIARLLLDHGADPNVKNDNGRTPVSLLYISKEADEAGVRFPLIDMLLTHGTDLLEMLKDEDPIDRIRAAETLARTGDATVIPALIEALKDESPGVRNTVTQGLARLGPPAVSALLAALKDGDGLVRGRAAEAMAWVKDPSIPSALVEALGDKVDFVRLRAAEALRRKHDLRAVPYLLEALNDRDRNVRHLAMEVLDKMGVLDEEN